MDPRSKLYRSIWTPSEIFGPPKCSHFEPWEPLVGLLRRLLGLTVDMSKLVTLKVRIKMSFTGVEAQIARWKHRNYEGAEHHCKIKAPNERTEQQESDGDSDDMEVDILQHVHV